MARYIRRRLLAGAHLVRRKFSCFPEQAHIGGMHAYRRVTPSSVDDIGSAEA